MSDAFARLPEPPYYAVIFSSKRRDGDDGYAATSDRMVELAQQQPGFLGVESTRGVDGFGITVAYWDSEEAIRAWRLHAEHTAARERGRADWYRHFEIRIARVERAYGWDQATGYERGSRPDPHPGPSAEHLSVHRRAGQWPASTPAHPASGRGA